MKRSPILFTVLLFVFAAGFPASAAAQQKDDKHLIRAKKLIDKKKYDKAVEEYKKSFQANPNWKAAYGIGSDRLRTNNNSEALNYFRQALDINKTEPLIYYSLGLAHARLNENEQAMGALQKAVELKPNYTDAWYNLGSVFYRLGRFAEAVEAYQKTVALNPKDAEAYAFLGITYDNLNDYDKAVEALQKALKISPNNGGYRQNLERVEGKLKEQKNSQK